ncbi:MAG: hypothetical protein UZ07_CHB004000126 [Chlorobi bacterium OLB7]|nr:MAG: hypothetical protein UZ07_CHB004000126 [Chlorobi bacterium OLB7]
MAGASSHFYQSCAAVAITILACTTQDHKTSPLPDRPTATAVAPPTAATTKPVADSSQLPEAAVVKQDPEFVEWLVNHALRHPRDARFIEIRDSTKQLRNYRKIPDGIEISDTLASGNRYVVRIIKKKFHPKQHRITRDSVGWVTRIDGQTFWGTDGGLPRDEIKKIQVFINGRAIAIPNRAWKPYYEPSLYIPDSTSSFFYVSAYESRNEQYCYLYMLNSDGAGAYEVKFIFDHHQYITDYALLCPLGLEMDGVPDK